MLTEILVTDTGRQSRPWTFSVSVLAQMVLISMALVVPLFFIEALPLVRLREGPLAAMPLAPPPPLGHAGGSTGAGLTSPVIRNPFVAPSKVPDGTIPLLYDLAAPTLGGAVSGISLPGGSPFGALGGTGEGIGPPGPSPKPAAVEPVKPAPTPPRVIVGGNVRPPMLLRDIKPVYPPLARAARISGLVRLESIIGKDGRIQSMRVVSGHPLLTQAAIDAVRQWLYRPTLLNGDPVEVILQIDVNFTLGR